MDHIPVEQVAAALKHCAVGDDIAARAAAEALRASTSPTSRRAQVPPAVMLAVFRRDQFTCRYCGQRTVLEAALRYVSLIFPDLLPYNRNWRRDATHPLYPLITTSLDHVVPVKRGGSNDAANLVTACSRCNYQKHDLLLEELGWQLLPPSDEPWDGLTELFLHAMAMRPFPELVNDVRRLQSLPAEGARFP